MVFPGYKVADCTVDQGHPHPQLPYMGWGAHGWIKTELNLTESLK